MVDVKPRGECVGWTRAEVSKKKLTQLKKLIADQVKKLLTGDPLPQGYELTDILIHYVREGPQPKNAEERVMYNFSVLIDDKNHIAVYRLEGIPQPKGGEP